MHLPWAPASLCRDTNPPCAAPGPVEMCDRSSVSWKGSSTSNEKSTDRPYRVGVSKVGGKSGLELGSPWKSRRGRGRRPPPWYPWSGRRRRVGQSPSPGTRHVNFQDDDLPVRQPALLVEFDDSGLGIGSQLRMTALYRRFKISRLLFVKGGFLQRGFQACLARKLGVSRRNVNEQN